MKVNTQSVNFSADGNLIDFVEKRMNKLDLFYDRITGADVYLKVINTNAKDNKTAEVKLHVPKEVFIVKKRCKTFEEAVDSACGSLERKLAKKKKKPKAYSALKFS
ncbi:MAG: ribosome hibernation-promoting factor, HPF/YfiA family [Robiginitalea sp.]|jgi:putative sigma-54 modulation protein|nr:MAG: ribosome-associated translation inhibitor RaiA [Flavobacteriaceae bacterium]